MLAQRTRKRVTCLAPAAAAMTLLSVFAASTAFARITANTIDPTASVADHGRQVIVTGPLACTEGERAFLRVTVTQRTTGAVAEGRTVITCTGANQQWEVRASLRGRETFEEGPAIAAALGRTADHSKTTDAHQWLVDITLADKTT